MIFIFSLTIFLVGLNLYLFNHLMSKKAIMTRVIFILFDLMLIYLISTGKHNSDVYSSFAIVSAAYTLYSYRKGFIE